MARSKKKILEMNVENIKILIMCKYMVLIVVR